MVSFLAISHSLPYFQGLGEKRKRTSKFHGHPALNGSTEILLGGDHEREEGEQQRCPVVIEEIDRICHCLFLHISLDVLADQRDLQHFFPFTA
jgi:hypothetical protein